jgi:Uncharacterised protein family (UPF0175)
LSNAGGIEEYKKPVAVEFPEELPGLLRMTEGQFAAEVRFLAAAKFYELGELNSGKAAAMAGLGQGAFLHKLGEYGLRHPLRFSKDSQGLAREGCVREATGQIAGAGS